VIDLRKDSPTYGHYVSAEISANSGNQLYVPVGFGHAFITLEPETEVLYKVSDFYFPDCDSGVRWDCPTIGIDWPLPGASVTLSEKDRSLPLLKNLVSPFGYDGEPLQLVQR
jgi:dTDP-4-dehydrorhamnose 3,5-epimerase